MDITQFKHIAKKLKPKISVLIKGDHGIGKSQCIYQLADELGLDVIERRLSQLTEGDMLGLPILEGGKTKFMPPDWIYEASLRPVVLFLDELNRATQEVMQAAFQLVLDRELNGVKLHPDTRIYTAINTSVAYQVNEMDPALLDRFFVADFTPSVEDWIRWAKEDGDIHPAIIDFIIQNERHLEHDGKNYDSNEVYPSRRSWERLNMSLNLDDIETNFGTIEFFSTCQGFIGAPASGVFQDFLKNYNKQISAEDILNRWGRTKKFFIKNNISNEKINSIIEKLEDHAKKNDWTPKQAERVASFIDVIPDELTLVLVERLQGHEKNFVMFYKYAQNKVLGILQEKMQDENNEEEYGD